MRAPSALEAGLLRRWEAEELTLQEFVPQLEACGWSRRDVFAYLERQAGGHPEEAERFSNRPKLINY